MYSPYLQNYINQLGSLAEIEPQAFRFLNETLACFIGAFGRAIHASTDPNGDLLQVSTRLLLLDDGLGRLPNPTGYEGVHYLIGLGFEQTGELLARLGTRQNNRASRPLESDEWYGLTLALLHYLAGGHRVQALSVLRHLEQMLENRGEYSQEYQSALRVLRQLHSGIAPTNIPAVTSELNWTQLVFGNTEPIDPNQARIARLARKIRQRRDIVLEDLGQGHETEWLGLRGIDHAKSVRFWTNYLKELGRRGITTFTDQQKGPEPGFEAWLRTDRDLLVILPTGSGKTIVGELRSALTLAEGKQVLWVLPTRALVRQTRRELRRAFTPLDVNVEELPTTEDFLALFTEGPDQERYLAATTPEKLVALIRANPESIANVGLVVVDEAQILAQENRGTTVEFLLQEIRTSVPACRLVLMSGFEDTRVLLLNFLQKLGREPAQLLSDVRPTRRVYGILTAAEQNEDTYPLVLLYPPGIQEEHGKTNHPFSIELKNVRASGRTTAGVLAKKFAGAVTPSGIRTVLFALSKSTTEVKAEEISKKNPRTRTLPREDCARIETELGRASAIVQSGQHEVVPHHAGLTPLEQHIVEKWVRDGIVKTVVATPTLAQGVNLPFDMSIVSFTSRRDAVQKNQIELPYSEILNMLGRAGRAGYVSDGICLLAVKRVRDKTARMQLDESRRFFFHPYEPSVERLGLSRLVEIARKVQIDDINWLTNLGGATLSESSSLISFVLQVGLNEAQPSEALMARMKSFPSLQDLPQSELEQIVIRFNLLLKNIKERCGVDLVILAALQRTGMPIEVLEYFFLALRSNPDISQYDPSAQTQWTDNTVRTVLDICSKREWHTALLKKIDLPTLFACISAWRSGLPLNEIESLLKLSARSDRDNRIAVGEFLNHKLPLLAQFWGVLSVCQEILNPLALTDSSMVSLMRGQTFVREGVESLEELEWLRAIGELDRVLAHYLARATKFIMKDQEVRPFIRALLKKWQKDQTTIPKELGEFREEIAGVLSELT